MAYRKRKPQSHKLGVAERLKRRSEGAAQRKAMKAKLAKQNKRRKKTKAKRSARSTGDTMGSMRRNRGG